MRVKDACADPRRGSHPNASCVPRGQLPGVWVGVGGAVSEKVIEACFSPRICFFSSCDLETRAGGGGRAQWAFSILGWAGMGTARGAGVQGDRFPGGRACLPSSLLLLLPQLPAPQWGGQRSAGGRAGVKLC